MISTEMNVNGYFYDYVKMNVLYALFTNEQTLANSTIITIIRKSLFCL